MSDRPDRADFVSQLTSHQRRIFGYIASMLPNQADTEEVLQQTNAILWAKADDYEPGTSFRAWSFRVAYLETLAYLRRQTRDRRLFSSDLIETISSEFATVDAEPSLEALNNCLFKLPKGDRELIERRYAAEVSVEQIASAVGRPSSSIYRSLDRIRFALLQCIQRALYAGGRS